MANSIMYMHEKESSVFQKVYVESHVEEWKKTSLL